MRRLAGVSIIEVTACRQKHEAVFDTGASISYVFTAMEREIAHEFEHGKFISDFYPGYGHFRIETWLIPIRVEGRTFRVRVGALPNNLRKLTKAFDSPLKRSLSGFSRIMLSADRRL
jgi:hypothetical protein